ncbi:type II toxin-antitoxin system RelE/ParE family toxin [Methylorubrum salsuginis]|uniref:Toxin ParE1/3/4 n=1 Tax=Methylorubrum salsuginis TaxID=414703 RepID=A0A1I4FTD3_9HYPH|nr:type II toxin-antitoxin system RelE/ParE family toxin [Methylorubrum salsuginis]SFL20560.1 toxin ParE1/3/4 [Methylorubrum salsuginis]
MLRRPPFSFVDCISLELLFAPSEAWHADSNSVTAVGFVDSLEAAFTLIGDHPAAGSPRYAHELDRPWLRSILLKSSPYPVFYVERGDHRDVWQVLHAHRDIPARMRPPEV